MTDPDLYGRIRWRAYLLWEQEGRPEGRAEDHWFRAEAEVAGLNSSEEAPPRRCCGSSSPIFVSSASMSA
jgi:hypothetical protein